MVLLQLHQRVVSRCLRRHFSHFGGCKGSPTFGVVFDIDGVLLREKTPLSGAKQVLEELDQRQIPFAIMTNGGGYTEQKKAKKISSILGVHIPSDILCIAHTPMRQLVAKHGDQLVLAVGKDCEDVLATMHSYGFKNVVTVPQLHSHFPDMYPDIKIASCVPHNGRFEADAFGAVFILTEPIYWGRELQIVMDVLCSRQGRLGDLSKEQHVPLYSACCDFQYVGAFHSPRFGAGAFGSLLEHLYLRTTGQELEKTIFGKPEKASFDYAETLIDKQHDNVQRIYMIGDNPQTDIKGANEAGGRWRSILTRTGIHIGTDNHDEYPAYAVVEDVLEALEFIKKDFAQSFGSRSDQELA